MLNELCKKAYEIAVSKGWNDPEPSFSDIIANLNGEISEAWNEYCHNHDFNETYYECAADGIPAHTKCFAKNPYNSCNLNPNNGYMKTCPYAKPCGIPSEFADTLIRVFYACHKYGIDLDKITADKMAFNENRSFRHGNKRA